MNNYTRGSEWGKWDLQVQTILDDVYVSLDSYYLDLKNADLAKWENFTNKVGGEENALKFDSKSYFGDNKVAIKDRCHNYASTLLSFVETYQPELRAIAITDHNYEHPMLMDALLARASKSAVTILPGVEINVGGVHLLVIFSKPPCRKDNYSEGIKAFLGKIGIDRKNSSRGTLTVTQKDITEVLGIIKKYKGCVIFPHCNTDNGLFQERQKTDRENLADIFNTQGCNILQTQSKLAAESLDNYIASNKHFKSKYCFTIGSDSRKLIDIGRADEKDNYFWAKADPSFNGLNQLHSEPKERAFIGKHPKKILEIEAGKDKYVKSLSVRHTSSTQHGWFNQEIPLNPGLIAIIGKKGSGKSALTDILALAGSTHIDPSNFSFLTPKKFLKRGLASEYRYEITWQDSTSSSDLLSKAIDSSTEPERIKYLPQKYVESICDEYGVSKNFQAEIERVIFSYIPIEKRLGRTSLEELLRYKDSAIEKAVIQLNIKLSEVNRIIERLEKKTKSDYEELIKEKITQKQKELENLKAPSIVPKPKKGTKTQKAISSLNLNIEKIEKEIETTEKKLAEASSKREKIKIVELQVDSLSTTLDTLGDDLASYLNDIGLKLQDLVSLKIDKTKLDIKKRKISDECNKFERLLGKTDTLKHSEKNLILDKDKLIKRRDDLKNKLGTEDTKYQNYLEAKEQYQRKRQEIIGKSDDKTLETLESLKDEKKYIRSMLREHLTNQYSARESQVKQIFYKKKEKIEYYEEIYKPLITVLENEKKTQEEADSVLAFNVEPVFDKQEFINRFEKLIDQRGRGNFRGKNEGNKKLLEILSTHDIESGEDIISLIGSIIDLLSHEMQGDQRVEVDIDKQLLNTTRAELYNFLYGLDYIEVQYNLKFNDKDLSEDQFSPGEKGALLLIFYLLIEKGKVPLVIDQPEENLDNESVFDLLVPYIRKAKTERQVILVTHNPNLAVVCDAEQIIHAAMDKKTNTITYTSGSLENVEINKKVSDVLEGTLPAFDIRNSKYYR